MREIVDSYKEIECGGERIRSHLLLRLTRVLAIQR